MRRRATAALTATMLVTAAMLVTLTGTAALARATEPAPPLTASGSAPGHGGPAGGHPLLGGYRPEPWRTWVQPEWSAPAGRYCSFPLQVRVVTQDVRVRVVARHPDGTVRREEFTGPLVVDFVNGDTAATARRDAGGSGAADYRPDGTWSRYTIVGPAGFGFRPGDHHPRGYYLLDGLHVVTIDADGTRRLAVGVGEQENVCLALGD
ncbi:hypothetical protein [Micromonospora fluostatini]|uniref:hypothetical protein n=1 Tax=Micromonospora sp. JCM 30529 TaxID=3421643 RepID=UPI003D179856